MSFTPDLHFGSGDRSSFWQSLNDYGPGHDRFSRNDRYFQLFDNAGNTLNRRRIFNRMNILGIVGGIGSGKSEVSRLLAQHGGVILDADRIGHDVLRETEVKEAIRQRFGDSIFETTGDPSGEIDRKKLAAIVFALSEKGGSDLAFLNGLTHPRISGECRRILAELKQQEVERVVLDAALLFESGWNEWTDVVIFVDVPESIRLERCEKRGWNRMEFLAREVSQWPVKKKRQLADYILPNSGTLADLEKEVQRFLDRYSLFTEMLSQRF